MWAILAGMRWIVTLVLAAGLWGADPRAELMEADRAFARDTAARGLEGWMSWFHEDAVHNGKQGLLKGKASLHSFYATFIGTPGFELVWEPLHAEASPDGQMGFTVGKGTVIRRNPDGTEQRQPAHYLTVWRRGADGKWKVVTDLGN